MAARDLLPAGVQRVVLVTDALHMPRSIFAMRSVGFEVIAAPTGYRGQAPFTPYQLVPGIGAMRLSHLALREWVSQAYYRLRNLVQ